jgi:hypothetical protein
MAERMNPMSKCIGNGMLMLMCCLFLMSCKDRGDEKVRTAAVTQSEVQALEDTGETQSPMQYSTSYGPRELSIIDFKGLFGRDPSALDIGRSGEYAFFKLMLAEGDHAVFSARLHDGKAESPVQLARGEEFNIAYISAHPSANECLLTSNYMAEDGHVHNRVWRAGPGLLIEIPYEQCSGFLADHPPDSLNDLRPYYSWNAAEVIVPTSYFGLSIVTVEGTPQGYVPMPDPLILVTGSQCGVLPDSAEGRQVYMSVWDASTTDEKCRIFTLDLDNPESFRLRSDQTWIVYRFSSPDLKYDPWVLQGSRLPDYLEVKRQVRIAKLDPESGLVEEQELGGRPEFNLAMDSLGRQCAFMDPNKQALVRLELESGINGQDRAWFSDDAKLFFSRDDTEIYVWKKDILYQANIE